jgi:hypothetical protein
MAVDLGRRRRCMGGTVGAAGASARATNALIQAAVHAGFARPGTAPAKAGAMWTHSHARDQLTWLADSSSAALARESCSVLSSVSEERTLSCAGPGNDVLRMPSEGADARLLDHRGDRADRNASPEDEPYRENRSSHHRTQRQEPFPPARRGRRVTFASSWLAEKCPDEPEAFRATPWSALVRVGLRWGSLPPPPGVRTCTHCPAPASAR